jgi:hypothetical protein
VSLRLSLLLSALVAVSPASVHAGPIFNGGFESGLSGWTVTTQAGSGGDFIAHTAGDTPISGLPSVGPASGLQYALSDQDAAAAAALSQQFTLSGPHTNVLLSFKLFVNDNSGTPAVNPAGLDYTADPNQHARVDLLRAGASLLSTDPADVLANFYLGSDPFATNPNPYTSYTFDITAYTGLGGTFILRFAEVNNLSVMNMGIDDVNITGDAVNVVPEPSSLILLGIGVGACVARRLRRPKVPGITAT